MQRFSYDEILGKGKERLHRDIRQRMSVKYDEEGTATIVGIGDGIEIGSEGVFYIFSDGVIEVAVASKTVLEILSDEVGE